MKKIPLFLFVFALVLHVEGQVKSLAEISPTTEEEYNYATRGYPETVAKGLDIKAGYRVEDLGSFSGANSEGFDIKLLIRTEKDELAAVIVKAKSKYWGKVYHVCVPINNPELTQRYYKDMVNWDSGLVMDYARISSVQMTNLMAAFASRSN